jgi:gliding motility-associated-like protein
MPNGFSPNGDGINDMLVVPCNILTPGSMRIWNRWGSEVYYNANYMNDWDGTYKGELLPAGTYFYSFRYKDAGGMETGLSGYVMIYQ